MKKTVKFLLTSILTVTSLGLVSVNIKDVKNGFVESTNDVAGEKINVGKKNAKSTVTTDDFVAGESVRVTNAVAQRRVEDNGTTIRFVAAAKADNLTEGIIGGDLGFHVRYAKDGTTVNKYVAVESVYKSMVAGDTTYTNTKMGDFLVSTGLGEASNPNGYDVFITYSIAEIPSTHISTEFEVQPFFLKTGEETREFAPGTKKANATGYTLKVGNGNVMSLTDATDEIGEKDTTCINQYKAEGLTVKAGDKLVFAVDGKVVKPGASGAGKNNASYNMTTHEVSIINDATNVTIYLKVFDDGGYDTWVTGYVKPVTEGYVVKLNGSVTKVEELALTDGNHYAYSITLKAGDKVVTEKDGKALVLPEYKDGTEFECTVAGEHKFYINKEDKVYVTEPVAPVETKYTVTVNHLFLDGSKASDQEVYKVKEGTEMTINAKSINGYVASHDYVKVHVLKETNVVNIYYSTLSVWDGTSVSSSLKGSGSLADPYLIESGADLAYIANVIKAHTEQTTKINSSYSMYGVFKDKNFKLVNSIDLGANSLVIGYYLNWNNYSVFDGILDGNNCSIRGMDIVSNTLGSGLFGGVGPHGVIKNISIYGDVESTQGTVAGLTGWLGGTIENCTGYANVTGTTDCGGLVGNGETGSIIINCTNYGNITSTAERVGGVAGTAKSIVTNCVNYGNVTSTSSNVGGVIGSGTSQDTTSTQSYLRNYGTVKGTNTIGGIIGLSYNQVENCTNYGEVIASSWNIGGIVGRVSSTSSLSNSMNHGDISSTADCVGGLVGTNQGKLSSSINYGSVTAKTKVGGVVFNNQGTTIGCINKGKVTGTNSNASVDGICQSNSGTITDCKDEYVG